MTRLRALAVALLVSAGLLLAGCTVVAAAGMVAGTGEVATFHYLNGQAVVVSFPLERGSSAKTLDALLDTELAADDALTRADAGSIDGNETGDDEYQLYFVGPDRQRMWQILEPIFAKAPLKWSRVELFESLDDDPDQVILPR